MNKFLKVIMVFLFAIVIMTPNAYAASSTSSSVQEPKLVVESVNIKSVFPGESYEIEFVLSNIGFYTVKNLDLYFKEDENSPFTVLDINPRTYIQYINPGASETLKYHIKVNSDAQEGIYKLLLEGTFYNTGNIEFAFSDFLNIPVEVNEDSVNLSVHLNKALEEIEAGTDFNAEIVVTNIGDIVPRDIEVNIANLDSSSIINTSANKHTFDIIDKSESVSAKFDLFVNNKLEEGIYPLEVNIKYINEEDKEVSETFEAFLKVIEEEQSALVIKNIVKSRKSVIPDKNFTVSFDIVNEGLGIADDIKVTLDHDNDIIPVTQSIFIVDDLGVGEIKTLTFELEATDNATTKNYPIGIEVEYNQGESISQYTGVYVSNDEEEDETDSSTPRIIINNFTTGQEKIFVGDEFNFDFSIKNTSSKKNVENLKIVINTNTGNANTDTVFLPVNQSNSLYVGNLNTGEIVDLSIPMKVIANAEGKIYSLEISFEYEDEDEVKYEDGEIVNIPVYQDTELTISDVRIGSQLDTAYTLEVDFYNTGKVDITNLMVDIEGDFNTNNSNYYVGDFSTGRTDIYDVEIQGTVLSTIEGNIIFTYDDTFGEEVSVTKEFKIGNATSSTETRVGAGGGGNSLNGSVPAMANGELEGLTREEIREKVQNGEIDPSKVGGFGGQQVEEIPNSNNIIPIIIGAGVIVVIIIIIIIKRKKKGKTYNA